MYFKYYEELQEKLENNILKDVPKLEKLIESILEKEKNKSNKNIKNV